MGFCLLLGTQWQSLPYTLRVSWPVKWTSFQIMYCGPGTPWWNQRAVGGERGPPETLCPSAALTLFIRLEAEEQCHSNLKCAYVGQHLGQFYEVLLAGSAGLMLVFSWGLRILMNHVTVNRPGCWQHLGDPLTHPQAFPPGGLLPFPEGKTDL